MKIYYRTSESGYNKVKLPFVNNENCLKNFCKRFQSHIDDIIVIADGIGENTQKIIEQYVNKNNILNVRMGNGAATFNYALDLALKHDDEEIVYFVENDYLHREESEKVLCEAFELGTQFCTLYDHLDKYFDGPNPYVQDGGEETKVFLSKSCHWKFTNSTTMTFAGKVKYLKQFESTFRKYTSTSHPHDFHMWIEIRNLGGSLMSPIPGYSTHGDLPTVAPLINWEKQL